MILAIFARAGRLARPLGRSSPQIRCLDRAQPPTPAGVESRTAVTSAKSSRSKKEVVDFDDLPESRLDAGGSKVDPLPPVQVQVQAGSRASRGSIKGQEGVKAAVKATAKPSVVPRLPKLSPEDEQYEQAVLAGEVPRSKLSREVFLHWKRFPDCIVLTRVGKFYESYFAPAIHLASLLSLRLAHKRYVGGLFPFAGFPVAQADKYLKILVRDLGHTVVLVEEYDDDGNKEVLIPLRKKTSGAELKERKVGRVLTPGTLHSEGWADGGEAVYLLAIAIGESSVSDGDRDVKDLPLSLAYTDASTGEFFLKETTMEYIEDELARIAPREVVLHRAFKAAWSSHSEMRPDTVGDDLLALLRVLGIHISFADPTMPATGPESEPTEASISFSQYIGNSQSQLSLETIAISLLRRHLEYALRDEMPDLNAPRRQSASQMMQIDAATLHALEIRHALRPGGLAPSGETFGRQISPISAKGSLLSVVAKTVTPSGHRLLVRTLSAPLLDVATINARLALVQAFVDRPELRLELRDLLKDQGDIMRIVQRFKAGRGEARDAWETGKWIRGVQKVLAVIAREVEHEVKLNVQAEQSEGITRLRELSSAFQDLDTLVVMLENSLDEVAIMKSPASGDEDGMSEDGDEMLSDEEPVSKKAKSAGSKRASSAANQDKSERENDNWYLKPSFSPTLAKLHRRLAEYKEEQAAMQAELRAQYGVETLSLVRGRMANYVVVEKSSEWAKIDKAASKKLARIGETKSSKSYAYNAWSALASRMDSLVDELVLTQRREFDALRSRIVQYANEIQSDAEMLDELDLGLCFATVAVERNYCRPVLNDSTTLNIVGGRHPVVENSLLLQARAFTPNTTIMNESSHLHIITGPNQGGKSTYLRQVAIASILAQSGCFVPAERAEMGIVDRVFSRIGARDDLYRDRSTFMLEMVETAAILRHATPRSLIIMDEIGRGTTLSSGLAIAYATLLHILGTTRCRTLFATHYHELADMLRVDGIDRQGVEYWCTDVEEMEGSFAYAYHLDRGINLRSHAIKAARLAGMPESFIDIAEKTLAELDPRQLGQGKSTTA